MQDGACGLKNGLIHTSVLPFKGYVLAANHDQVLLEAWNQAAHSTRRAFFLQTIIGSYVVRSQEAVPRLQRGPRLNIFGEEQNERHSA